MILGRTTRTDATGEFVDLANLVRLFGPFHRGTMSSFISASIATQRSVQKCVLKRQPHRSDKTSKKRIKAIQSQSR